MKNSKLTLICILSAIIVFSCQNDDDTGAKKEFYSDGMDVFTFKEDGDNIDFALDVLSDQTQGLYGEWPDLDVMYLFVDYNRNGVVDSGVDVAFSHKDAGICMVTLTGQTTTSGCNNASSATGSRSFGISESLDDVHHASFFASIPKSLLSETNKADFVLRLHDNGTGEWKSYPSDKDLFEDTYTISW